MLASDWSKGDDLALSLADPGLAVTPRVYTRPMISYFLLLLLLRALALCCARSVLWCARALDWFLARVSRPRQHQLGQGEYRRHIRGCVFVRP